jgi:hypothetical protein
LKEWIREIVDFSLSIPENHFGGRGRMESVTYWREKGVYEDFTSVRVFYSKPIAPIGPRADEEAGSLPADKPGRQNVFLQSGLLDFDVEGQLNSKSSFGWSPSRREAQIQSRRRRALTAAMKAGFSLFERGTSTN